MVGNATMRNLNTPEPPADLSERLETEFPELAALRRAAGETPIYLVGGAVRDLLLGRDRSDVDVVVEGDVAALARALGGEVTEHERFSTAKAAVDGLEVDLARAREETYAAPGALPDVRPAGLERDLARRDFTVNAMALPLDGGELIDPHGGLADLQAARLRVLHDRSFVDDPTRALRAARYAARFGFGLEPETERLLRATDLGTVSADRRNAELRRIAAEPSAPEAFRLLALWGLVELRAGGAELAGKIAELLAEPPWSEVAPRDETVVLAALGPPGEEEVLAQVQPKCPSEAVGLARGHSAMELALARVLGADWLEDYVRDWRSVVLQISGDDLIAAGVPEGPRVGAGLAEALRRKLDGEVSGREEELAAALEAARGEGSA
jgi:tRNA nucleotidyltransferase (CCA-adding enzyme)